MQGSVCYREFSRACGPDDIPYYPIRLVEEKEQLADMSARAEQEDACHLCRTAWEPIAISTWM